MIKIISKLLLVGVAVGGLTSAHAQLARKEAIDMAEASERRIQQSVQSYLGPDSRAIVNVYINADTPTAEQSNKSTKAAPTGWEIMGDYIPSVAEVLETPDSLFVNNAEVSIQVEKNVDDAKRLKLQEIAKRVMRGINIKVSVTADLDPTSSIMAARSLASEAPASGLENFLKRFGGAAPVAAAVVLVFGLAILGLMMKASTRELAEGIKLIRTQVSNSGTQTIQLTGDFDSGKSAKAIENKPETGAARPPLPISNMTPTEARHNLAAIESYILQAPLLFVRSVGDGPDDLMGLKFLVARVSAAAKVKLKDLLGAERILKASNFNAGSEIVGFDARGWIQNTIEKIEMKKLSGGSVVEEALSTEESLLLTAASEESLYDAAIKSNSPAAWRVATDFISSDFLKKRAKDLDETTMRVILRGSLIQEQQEVLGAAKNLIEIVRVSVSETSVLSKAARESEEHFSKRIMPAITDAVMARNFGDDDKLLESFCQEAPQFAHILNDRIWTPAKLDLLTDESLKSVFLRLDNEKRSYLIYVLPERHAQRLQGFLPEGNAKKIIADMVSRMKGTVDDKKKEAMNNFARGFFDYLRVQVSKGELQVKVQVAAQPKSTQAEVVDAEVVEPERKAS